MRALLGASTNNPNASEEFLVAFEPTRKSSMRTALSSCCKSASINKMVDVGLDYVHSGCISLSSGVGTGVAAGVSGTGVGMGVSTGVGTAVSDSAGAGGTHWQEVSSSVKSN